MAIAPEPSLVSWETFTTRVVKHGLVVAITVPGKLGVDGCHAPQGQDSLTDRVLTGAWGTDPISAMYAWCDVRIADLTANNHGQL